MPEPEGSEGFEEPSVGNRKLVGITAGARIWSDPD
jgi:hypothetical protein